jgi:hypothetical protein
MGDDRDYVGICPECRAFTAAMRFPSSPKDVGRFHREMLESDREFGRATGDEIREAFGHRDGCSRKPMRQKNLL